MMQCTICGVNAGCKCVFTKESIATGKPVCKKCAETAQHEELAEIEAAQNASLEEKQIAIKPSMEQLNEQHKVFTPPSPRRGQAASTPALNRNDEKQALIANKRHIRVYHADGERMALYNVLAGRQAFLVCSGPSLNQMNLSLLNQRGIVTMGINNSPAVFKPNYWICGDTPRRFIEQIWKDPTITKFAPHGRRNMFPRVRDADGNLKDSAFRVCQMPNTYFFNRGEWFDAKYFLEDGDFPWGGGSNTPDAYGIRGYKSTMILALKMLWYLGAGTVYLLGCDFKMENGAQNYAFKQERPPDVVRLNIEVFNALNRRLKELKPYFDRVDFKVVNCTPNSGLQVFPYMEFTEAVNKAAAECNEKPIITEGMYEEAN